MNICGKDLVNHLYACCFYHFHELLCSLPCYLFIHLLLLKSRMWWLCWWFWKIKEFMIYEDFFLSLLREMFKVRSNTATLWFTHPHVIPKLWLSHCFFCHLGTSINASRLSAKPRGTSRISAWSSPLLINVAFYWCFHYLCLVEKLLQLQLIKYIVSSGRSSSHQLIHVYDSCHRIPVLSAALLRSELPSSITSSSSLPVRTLPYSNPTVAALPGWAGSSCPEQNRSTDPNC